MLFIWIFGYDILSLWMTGIIGKSCPPAESEYRWCPFWSKVMTSEEKQRPGVNGLRNLTKFHYYSLNSAALINKTFGLDKNGKCTQLVRQSQIVQSVMQDYQYDLSHLLPVSNSFVQGPKKTYITVCQDGQGYCGVLHWISLILNSLIRWTSKRDNFIFSTPTFLTWYFCFPRKVCNMIPLFSQKTYKGSFLICSLFSSWRVMKWCYYLWKKRKKNDFVSFKRQIFFSLMNNYWFNYQIVSSCLGIARSY